MISFVFKVSEFASTMSSYNLMAYTEGSLNLIIDNQIFIKEQGVLLVEMAKVLHEWVISKGNLYYSSMDFEEEPFIEFRKVGEVSYKISSALESCTSSKVINEVDLESAVKNFLEELKTLLIVHYFQASSNCNQAHMDCIDVITLLEGRKP